nr:MAG TPA: hypothetical protein [Caudoviricetes sp.]DAT37507.1 MAG TPA: hypothetical protein [Caudoviricetes sp.]
MRPVYRFKPPRETTNAKRRTKKKSAHTAQGCMGAQEFSRNAYKIFKKP